MAFAIRSKLSSQPEHDGFVIHIQRDLTPGNRCQGGGSPPRPCYAFFFLFLALTLNQMGDPMNLKLSRISLAKNRS